ncbi:MAG: histidine phosphatase family protein [Actinomycetota bacterium]|nr:histidine phosphatase family protein [Actinomycetota bacterium]
MSVLASVPAVPEQGCGFDRRLWLVRHGESTWNAAGLVQGQRDPGLSPAGREQAARCATLLAAQTRPEVLYSSDLRRAVETAAPIAEALGLPICIEPRLRERSLGDAEGIASVLLGPRCSGVERARVADADAAPEGGESVRQLYGRVAACVAQILAAHRGDVVLVCHGGVVRVVLAWLDGIAPEDMTWPVIENALLIQRDLRRTPACA